MGGAVNLGTVTEVHCCPTCGASSRKMEFRGEICLHFPGGLESLNKPLVWMFPQVSVRPKCGAAQFTVPQSELKLGENL
jgi:hypothetical protein